MRQTLADTEVGAANLTRKFNPTQAPITRPPSATGNRSTKIQKIKPSTTRKRHTWNDRFHLENAESTAEPSKPRQRRVPKTYSNIQSTLNTQPAVKVPKRQKKRKSTSSGES